MAIAFLSSKTPKAENARRRLVDTYGHVDIDKATVVVALGGDGFLVSTLKNLANKGLDLPVYGITVGTVGFLMNTHDFDSQSLAQVLHEAESQTLRSLEAVIHDTQGKTHTLHAINDVSLLRASPQAATLKISVGNETRMDSLVCDGLILATPAGSTAYTTSAGGPALPIDANVLALTPVAPFRPRRWQGAILPMNAMVSLDILDPEKRPVMVAADGAGLFHVKRVDIRVSAERTYTVLFSKGHGLQDRILHDQFS